MASSMHAKFAHGIESRKEFGLIQEFSEFEKGLFGITTRGSPSAGGAQPEIWADGEVEIVAEQDNSQGQAAITEATDRKAAGATGSSTGDAAKDTEAVKRRLCELHRLLNSRRESVNATKEEC